jgi:ribosomal-protein-alanine N-acetyltransferase
LLDVEIREIQEEHIAQCVKVVPQIEPWVTLGATPEGMEKYFRKLLNREEGFVALLRGEVVGFITIKSDFLHGCYIRRLAVKEGYRGKGIGRQIMRFIEDYAFVRYPNVFVCVSSFNSRAQKFYEDLGYQKVGELPNLIMEGHAEYLLRKTLGPVSNYDHL